MKKEVIVFLVVALMIASPVVVADNFLTGYPFWDWLDNLFGGEEKTKAARITECGSSGGQCDTNCGGNEAPLDFSCAGSGNINDICCRIPGTPDFGNNEPDEGEQRGKRTPAKNLLDLEDEEPDYPGEPDEGEQRGKGTPAKNLLDLEDEEPDFDDDEDNKGRVVRRIEGNDNGDERRPPRRIPKLPTPTNLKLSLSKNNEVILTWDNVLFNDEGTPTKPTLPDEEFPTKPVLPDDNNDPSSPTGFAVNENGGFFNGISNFFRKIFGLAPVARQIKQDKGIIENKYRIYRSTTPDMKKAKAIVEGNENKFNCNKKSCRYIDSKTKEGLYYYGVASKKDNLESSMSDIAKIIVKKRTGDEEDFDEGTICTEGKTRCGYTTECNGEPCKLSCSNNEWTNIEYCSDQCSYGECVTVTEDEENYVININIEPTGSGNVIKFPDKTTFDQGDAVTLTANSIGDYAFINWNREGNSYNDNPLSITINSNEDITARFGIIERPECTTNVECQDLYDNINAICNVEGICVIPAVDGSGNEQTIILNGIEITIIGEGILVEDAFYLDNKYTLILTSEGEKELGIRGLESPEKILIDSLQLTDAEWGYNEGLIDLPLTFSTKTIVLDYNPEDEPGGDEPGGDEPGAGGNGGGSGGGSGGSGGGSGGGSSSGGQVTPTRGTGDSVPRAQPEDTETQERDSDGDNLPDYWEIQFFGNLDEDADGDYDGDGISNLEEYQFNTDPTVPNKKKSPIWTIIIIIIILGVLGAAAFFIIRKIRGPRIGSF